MSPCLAARRRARPPAGLDPGLDAGDAPDEPRRDRAAARGGFRIAVPKKMRGGVTTLRGNYRPLKILKSTRLPSDVFGEILEMHPLFSTKLTNATIRRRARGGCEPGRSLRLCGARGRPGRV